MCAGHSCGHLIFVVLSGIREGSSIFFHIVQPNPTGRVPFSTQAMSKYDRKPGRINIKLKPSWKMKVHVLKMESFSQEGEDIF